MKPAAAEEIDCAARRRSEYSKYSIEYSTGRLLLPGRLDSLSIRRGSALRPRVSMSRRVTIRTESTSQVAPTGRDRARRPRRSVPRIGHTISFSSAFYRDITSDPRLPRRVKYRLHAGAIRTFRAADSDVRGVRRRLNGALGSVGSSSCAAVTYVK